MKFQNTYSHNNFKKAQLLIILIIAFYSTISVEQSDHYVEATTKYEIPSYYGSRDQDFNTKGFAISSNYSSFYWSHSVDIDNSTNIIYAIDLTELTIKQITTDYNVTVIASISGGYRDGDTRTALFNQSKALAFSKINKYYASIAKYKKIIVLKNNSASCIALNQNCQDTTLNNNSEIDLSRLSEYYNIPSSIILPDINDYFNEVLIIADTKNHCIRKIDLVTNITTTIAGQCTVAGFQDGPLGTNLIDSPSSLGVDEQGFSLCLNSLNIDCE